MALPLLAGAAKGLMAGAAKGAASGAAKGAAKKFLTGKKKQKTEGGTYKKTSKTQDVGKKVKTKVKPKQKKVQTVKLPDSVYKNQSDSAQSTSDKNVSFESLGKQLDNINKTTSSMVGLSEAEKNAQKEKNKAVRAKTRKDKLAAKEEQLEKKKGGGGLLGVIKTTGKNFNIFDFLTNIALGGLVLFAVKNYKTIEDLLNTLSENFSNPFKLLKSILVGISTAFAGPVKGVFKILWKGLKFSGNLIKKSAKKLFPLFKKVFGGLGRGIVNFAKGIVDKAKGIVTGGGKGGAKAAAGTVASQKSRAMNKAASNVAKQQASKSAAKNLFGKGGKRLLKIGNIFKRVPVIGGLLSIFIDLLLGEPLDRAVVGAVGGGIGAWIGGGIGSLVFPFAGTAAGAILGSMIGDWAGKALYEMMKKKMGLVPKVDPKDKGFSGTPKTDKEAKVGQQRNVGGLMMVWDGQNYVTQQEYIQKTGKQPLPVGAQSTPSQTAIPNQPTGTRASTGGITKEQQSLLDAISFAEGTRKSYGTIFGGKVVPELAQGKLTIGQVLEMQRTGMLNGRKVGYGTSYNSDATGRYQFMSYVLREEMQKQGYTLDTLFTPELQDKMILGRISRFRGVTPALLAKEGLSTRVLDMLAPEFASFPYSPKGGRSYYDQPVKTAGSIRDAYNKSLGMPQSSQPTPTMQPASQQTSSVPLGRNDPFAPVQPAELAQQQNTTVATQGTINDMYKGATNTSMFPTKSGYGMRIHPIHGDYRMHTGVDIAPPGPGYYVGLKVPGKVTRIGNDSGGYGKFVIISSQETGMSYMFAHMATIDVKMGEAYTGQPIGEMGTTGGSTGIHLHYEVYKGGKDGPAVNPEPYMNLLTMGKIDGQVRSQTAQISPNQQTPNQGATVSSRPSYDPRSQSAGGGVIPIPVGGQSSMPGGGNRAPSMGGASTQQVLNSYYKSQLLGFLYKQG